MLSDKTKVRAKCIQREEPKQMIISPHFFEKVILYNLMHSANTLVFFLLSFFACFFFYAQMATSREAKNRNSAGDIF